MKISACSFVIKGQQQRVVVDGKDTKYGYDTYISKRIFREQMSGGKKTRGYPTRTAHPYNFHADVNITGRT